MGAGAVNDAVPQRGLRDDAYEERYGACEYVAVGREWVALGEEEEVGEGDGCYISVLPPCFITEMEGMLERGKGANGCEM